MGVLDIFIADRGSNIPISSFLLPDRYSFRSSSRFGGVHGGHMCISFQVGDSFSITPTNTFEAHAKSKDDAARGLWIHDTEKSFQILYPCLANVTICHQE